jgi:hypothetical protein
MRIRLGKFRVSAWRFLHHGLARRVDYQVRPQRDTSCLVWCGFGGTASLAAAPITAQRSAAFDDRAFTEGNGHVLLVKAA